MSRHPDDHYIQCPDDIEPVDHGRFNRASDEYMDRCEPESAEDKAAWLKIKADFMARWEHLLFQPGCLSKRQALSTEERP
jgi:hypothetical protein